MAAAEFIQFLQPLVSHESAESMNGGHLVVIRRYVVLEGEGGVGGVNLQIFHGSQEIVKGHPTPGHLDQPLGEGSVDGVRVSSAKVAHVYHGRTPRFSRGFDPAAKEEQIPLGILAQKTSRAAKVPVRKPVKLNVVLEDQNMLHPGGQGGAETGHVRLEDTLLAIGRMLVDRDKLHAFCQANAFKFGQGAAPAIGSRAKGNAADAVEETPRFFRCARGPIQDGILALAHWSVRGYSQFDRRLIRRYVQGILFEEI